MAIPLVLVRKISEIITHGMGPNEEAKQAMYAKIKINNHGPRVKSKYKHSPTANKQITIPATPQSKYKPVLDV